MRRARETYPILDENGKTPGGAVISIRVRNPDDTPGPFYEPPLPPAEKWYVHHLPSDKPCEAVGGPSIYVSEQDALNSVASTWSRLKAYGATLRIDTDPLGGPDSIRDAIEPAPFTDFSVRPYVKPSRA
jgi:hypothetical protein